MEAKANVRKVRTIRVAGLADKAAEAAHEGIDALQTRAKVAEQELVGKAEEGSRELANRAGGVMRRVTTYIEANPFVAVGLAFGVGILAATMMRASGVDLKRLLDTPPGGADVAD